MDLLIALYGGCGLMTSVLVSRHYAVNAPKVQKFISLVMSFMLWPLFWLAVRMYIEIEEGH